VTRDALPLANLVFGEADEFRDCDVLVTKMRRATDGTGASYGFGDSWSLSPVLPEERTDANVKHNPT